MEFYIRPFGIGHSSSEASATELVRIFIKRTCTNRGCCERIKGIVLKNEQAAAACRHPVELSEPVLMFLTRGVMKYAGVEGWPRSGAVA